MNPTSRQVRYAATPRPIRKGLVAVLWIASVAALLPHPAAAAEGMASYYGGRFHGRRTASGQRFNQNALTAAHRSLRFGTRVRVTNARNGHSVVVTVNDRGPYARGRVIDLSRAAAGKLGMLSAGVAPVRLEVVGAPKASGGGIMATSASERPVRSLSDLF
jgi:rare lipoprotein A